MKIEDVNSYVNSTNKRMKEMRATIAEYSTLIQDLEAASLDGATETKSFVEYHDTDRKIQDKLNYETIQRWQSNRQLRRKRVFTVIKIQKLSILKSSTNDPQDNITWLDVWEQLVKPMSEKLISTAEIDDKTRQIELTTRSQTPLSRNLPSLPVPRSKKGSS